VVKSLRRPLAGCRQHKPPKPPGGSRPRQPTRRCSHMGQKASRLACASSRSCFMRGAEAARAGRAISPRSALAWGTLKHGQGLRTLYRSPSGALLRSWRSLDARRQLLRPRRPEPGRRQRLHPWGLARPVRLRRSAPHPPGLTHPLPEPPSGEPRGLPRPVHMADTRPPRLPPRRPSSRTLRSVVVAQRPAIGAPWCSGEPGSMSTPTVRHSRRHSDARLGRGRQAQQLRRDVGIAA
jgi:hypothetical protein